MEIGIQVPRKQAVPCRYEYVLVSWNNSSSDVILCGNMTRNHMQWISDGNYLSVQLVSVKGKDGRGFHASYKFGMCKHDKLKVIPSFNDFGPLLQNQSLQ